MDSRGNQKCWWVPVWTGLVIDGKGTHYKRIKSAIWLHLYLLLNADRKSGFLKRKIKTISQDMGIKKSTIRIWMDVLKRHGYVKARSTGRCLLIEITKWKGTAECQNSNTQSVRIPALRVLKFHHSEETSKSENPLNSSGEIQFPLAPNDISIKKDILNIDIERGNHSESDLGILAGFKPKTKEDRLALDLAQGLNDMKGLPFYFSCTKKYTESLLRKVLREVKALPDDKVKKSRGALFNYLIQKYSQKAS